MNTNNVKRYAPKARLAFIEAVSKQAAKYGVTKNNIEPVEQKGDLVLIGDRPFPSTVIKPRERLVKRIEQQGFDQVMEYVAYSWFNRLCALRYMELKDYLDHGRRVLSSPSQTGSYQILDDCLDIELAGIDQTKIRMLKLDGTQDELLYRELLLAQCHALHKAMPFLFEAVDDETELLLPENLTKTDSLIHELVNEIPEEDWQSVEIIGWLYQFYISEKKDEVIGKVVKSEDIPAATQLFTPNWIVKYMVQNSLGAQWLATYPESPLKASMEYYITPAQQTDEVNAQLKSITPSTLNPEKLTLIDPACGSGHILVEAYDLFKAIYLERGYRQRDIAQLILERNLFGLDIDTRAAQLTGFALMMKGRDDDRRLFERDFKLNVMAMVDSSGFDVDALVGGVKLTQYGLEAIDVIEIKKLFEYATTFGSLLQVPNVLKEKLPALKKLSEFSSEDIFVSDAIKALKPLIAQAQLLSKEYDAVVVNPPYMGSGGMNAVIKSFVKKNFTDAKENLFACFIERCCHFAGERGLNAMVTMHNWMFLSSFQKIREKIISSKSIASLAHLGAGAFDSISGEVVQAVTFVLRNMKAPKFIPVFFQLLDGSEEGKNKALLNRSNKFCEASQSDFKNIPGSPIAYWISSKMRKTFTDFPAASSIVEPREGLATGNNDKYVRCWPEVSIDNIRFNCESRKEAKESGVRWFPYNKGGELRKWAGNNWFLVDWSNDGHELQTRLHPSGSRIWAHNFNLEYIFRPFITWSDITSKGLSVRMYPSGYLFDATGLSAFAKDDSHLEVLMRTAALGNSCLGSLYAEILNPTLHFKSGNFADLPIIENINVSSLVKSAVEIATGDWNMYERSWNFTHFPIINCVEKPTSIESSYANWISTIRNNILEMKDIEEKSNQLFIDAYGLSNELSFIVPVEQITLTVNPAHRYGQKLTEDEQWTRFREDTMKELVSYSIGCMMGRYSLDEPGLIYAHSGNQGFDPSSYQTFIADNDGIIPLTDKEWFSDDAANRLEEFIAAAWDAAHLEENLGFLADNLSPKKGESSRETIRRYLCDSFYKDHTQTYKKRPIYWLFTSGKQKAFQCLVYLHRYNEGTLARMRTQYVIPLTAKLAAHVNKLEQDKDASTSTPEIKKLEKEIATLHKEQAELSTFDEKLRHYADQRITLDLDDGVKVNYGKFGDLLADVKVITGDAAGTI